MTRTAGARTP